MCRFSACCMDAVRLGYCRNPWLGYDDVDTFLCLFGLLLLLEVGGSSLSPFISVYRRSPIGGSFWLGLAW